MQDGKEIMNMKLRKGERIVDAKLKTGLSRAIELQSGNFGEGNLPKINVEISKNGFNNLINKYLYCRCVYYIKNRSFIYGR